MSMTKTLTAAVIASVAIGGLAGCADNAEQVNKLDTQVKALSARVDKLGGGSESASSDDSAALKAEVSAIKKEVANLKLENESLKAKAAGSGTATAEVDALRLRDKELQDEINALKTVKPAGAGNATVAAGVDLATNDAAKFEALVADAVAKKQADDREKQRTEQRTRSREQFVGDFVRRLDTIAKDKNIPEAEVTTIKAAYEKQYDQMAPLWEVMMGGGRGGFGGNSDVTQEQRDEARKQMDTIRTETEATLKTSISQTSYDAVKGLFQPGGRQRGPGGGPTGDTGGATPPAAGGDTATPAPRNTGRRNNGGNGNGNGAGTGTDTPAPAGGRNTPRRGGNGNGN